MSNKQSRVRSRSQSRRKKTNEIWFLGSQEKKVIKGRESRPLGQTLWTTKVRRQRNEHWLL